MLCDGLVGWDGGGEEVQEAGDMCMHMAVSLGCAAETNSTL